MKKAFAGEAPRVFATSSIGPDLIHSCLDEPCGNPYSSDELGKEDSVHSKNNLYPFS